MFDGVISCVGIKGDKDNSYVWIWLSKIIESQESLFLFFFDLLQFKYYNHILEMYIKCILFIL